MHFVAGFMGRENQWKEYVRLWRDALRPRTSIHVSELRLNSRQAPKRYGRILEELAQIPGKCGLIPVFGSISRNDYAAMVQGTELQVLMEGYALAILALMDAVEPTLRGERIKVLCESREVYAAIQARAMEHWSKTHRTAEGWSVLAEWGSIPKGTLTEAADYLCYALHQRHADSNSQKARLTAPILSRDLIGHHTGKAEVDYWLEQLRKTRLNRALTSEIKKDLLR